MPIGVPKVPFRIPGEEDAVWVDVYNRLYRERLLFPGQQVDDEIANQLIGIMMYLNGEDENKDIYPYINSPGGAVIPGPEHITFELIRKLILEEAKKRYEDLPE